MRGVAAAREARAEGGAGAPTIGSKHYLLFNKNAPLPQPLVADPGGTR